MKSGMLIPKEGARPSLDLKITLYTTVSILACLVAKFSPLI